MQKLITSLRRTGFIIMIILASVGIGLVGGIPLPLTKRKDQFPVKIELAEDNEDDEEVQDIKT